MSIPERSVNPSEESDNANNKVASSITLRRLALLLVVLGVVWRLVRYFLRFPIWGDEALLAMNFAWFDYSELCIRLENCQIAPILFLWGERAAWVSLGPDELSMRLLPLLAGLGSLGLFWRLTRLLLEPMARVFAIGFLSVAIWPVSMSTFIKPYSCDLFMSLLLLVPTVEWLTQPTKFRWLVCLIVVTPIACLGSYPVVFIGGGVSVALVWRARSASWRIWALLLGFHLALLGGFFLSYTVGKNHLNNQLTGTSTQEGMTKYWADTFPPDNLLKVPWWFVLQTTGQMTAYPLGSESGGSIVTVMLCLVGVRWWFRNSGGVWLLLFGLPFLLQFIAAILHRYPYGGSCRLNQHLAPLICILAGLGVARILQSKRLSPKARKRWMWSIFLIFVVIGVGGIVRDLIQPYRDYQFIWMRETIHSMHNRIPQNEKVVVSNPLHGVEVVFAWYWVNQGHRVSWNSELPTESLTAQRIWGYHFVMSDDPAHANNASTNLLELLQKQDTRWKLIARYPYPYPRRNPKEYPQQCELFEYERTTK